MSAPSEETVRRNVNPIVTVLLSERLLKSSQFSRMLRFDHAPRSVHAIPRLALAALGIGVFLSGCGFIRYETREPWRAEAELACMKSGIVKQSQFIRPTKPIDGPGPCGTDLPLKVGAFENDTQYALAMVASAGPVPEGFSQGLLEMTVLKPEATLGCPMVAWTDDWIAGNVQPAALAWFGQGVKEIRTGGSYACRRRNHMANARLSEHAFGNAIDVMSFVLNDGNVVTVKGGWRGTEQEQGFLRDVFHGACQRFRTVLGPGSDALHYDHFHLDLAHHDAQGKRRYCKPQVAAPQRPAPGSFAPFHNPGPNNAYAYNPLPAPPTQLQASGSPVYNRPPAALQPMRPPAPAMNAPEARQDNEVEPDFDPAQFDIVTGSIPELPRGRRLEAGAPGDPRQPLPPVSGAMEPTPRPQPKRSAAPAPRRTPFDPPAGK